MKSRKSTLKTKFRAPNAWKDFRKEMMIKQKSLDPLTGSKLISGCNLHHRLLDLDMESYKDLSNPENFLMVNKQTHEVIHWILRYVKLRGWDFFEKLEKEIKLEAELNGWNI